MEIVQICNFVTSIIGNSKDTNYIFALVAKTIKDTGYLITVDKSITSKGNNVIRVFKEVEREQKKEEQ